MKKVVYIHLEPDNGGIVLNVSDGGVCFHSVAPIHQTGEVTFWLAMQEKDRIQGRGRLVWTDKTKKTGALRLNLSDQERKQFRAWVEEPPKSLNPKSIPPVVSPVAPNETPFVPPLTARDSRAAGSRSRSDPIPTPCNTPPNT